MKYICDTCGNPTDNAWFCKDHFSKDILDRCNWWDKASHTCDACEAEEKAKEEWKNEHLLESSIICPWCEYEFEDYENVYDEGEDEIECPCCEKPIEVEARCDWRWTSRKPEKEYQNYRKGQEDAQ